MLAIESAGRRRTNERRVQSVLRDDAVLGELELYDARGKGNVKERGSVPCGRMLRMK